MKFKDNSARKINYLKSFAFNIFAACTYQIHL